MISIIITAFKEEKTVGRAIESFLNNKMAKDHEILVICPDDGTKKVIKEYEKKYKVVKHIQDQGHGKPAALNYAFKFAKGDILILTDGDVYISENAVGELLKRLENKKTGAVTAKGVSTSPRNTMLGYWSHLLVAGINSTRSERVKKGKFIVVTGYLFAMKRLFEKIPEDALSDDAVMSYMIWQKGYNIDYADSALVYIKYPATFKDWILQKRRSTGGYKQIKDYFGKGTPKMRTLSQEIFYGTWKAITFPKSTKEVLYTMLLFPARLYLWFKIYIDLHLRNKSFKEIRCLQKV